MAHGAKEEFSREQLESKLRIATESMADIKENLDTALDEHYRKPVLTISEKDELIKSLRQEVAFEKAKYEAIQIELNNERKEHHKQKNATSQMWKFIHTRHRLDVKPENGTIKELLANLEKR